MAGQRVRGDVAIRRPLRWFVPIIVVDVVIGVWTLLTPHLPDTELLGLFKQTFNLGLELNLAVWWSSMMLAAAALGALVLSRRAGEDTWGWTGLAVVFASLSLDELGSLHERNHGPARYVAIAVYAAITCAALFRLVQRDRSTQAGLVAAALGLFALAFEPLEELNAAATGGFEGIAILLEEGAELLAIGLILLAVVMTSSDARTARADVLLPAPDHASTRWACLSVLGVGAVVAVAYLPSDGRGDPGRWFAAAGFVIVAAVVWDGRDRWATTVRPTAVLLVALWLSLDSAYHLRDVPGGERVIPELGQHWSTWLLAVALWWLVHERLTNAAVSTALLVGPLAAIGVTPLTDDPRLQHTLMILLAAGWLVALGPFATVEVDGPAVGVRRPATRRVTT